jgi:hypothetical protein
MERPKTAKYRLENVSNWLNGTKPLAESESTFFDDWEDLVSPNNPVEKGSLHYFIENCIKELSKRGYKKVNYTTAKVLRS